MKTTSSTRRLLGIDTSCAVLALLLSSAPAGIVTNTDDSGPGSLRQAIADASSGDTITFDSTLSGQTIVLTSGELTVDKDLVIDASGLAEPVTIDAHGSVTNHRVLLVTSDVAVVLDSLVLTGGVTPDVVGGSALPGGGVYNAGDLTMRRVMVCRNSTGRNPDEGGRGAAGGGIFNTGSLVLKDCTVAHNSTGTGGGGFGAGGSGGGIYSSLGSLKIENSIISHNITGGGGPGGFGRATGGLGGGIYNYATRLEIEQSTIAHNATGSGGSNFGSGGSGGGIHNAISGLVILKNSAVLHNSTGDGAQAGDGGHGGGIYSRDVATLWMENCTVSGNTTGDGPLGGVGGDGAGVFSARFTIRNCTISGNHALGKGGGVLRPPATTPTLGNSIVSGNSSTAGDPDLHNESGPVNLEGHNLLSADAWLAPLGDYGGPTQTMPPLPGSPVIDAGGYSSPAADQRGTPRPLDGDGDGIARIDIGAYEFASPVADTDGDGLTDGHELDTTGTNPTLMNTDGDPQDDYEEWIADTDGTDPADWFRIDGSKQGKWMVIRFITSPNRNYTLRCCPDLGEGTWTDVPGFLRIRGRGCPHTFFVRRPASPACFWKVEPGIP